MARESKRTTGIRWRLWLGLLLAGCLCVSTGLAAFRIQRFAVTDPQFTLSPDRRDALQIGGVRYGSRAKLLRVFAQDFGRSIFLVPLAERRRRLLAVDWVADASVARIWPDRLVVRVTERTPVAFVLFGSGVLLVDAHGVLLEPPAQAQFPFPVLKGVREDEPEADRRRRVRLMLRLLEEVGPHAKDVSEVNTADTDNLKMVVQIEGRVLELAMGDGNYGRRFQIFLKHYPEMKRRSEGATSFDLRLDDRITAKE
jgi:cell division protein FtsQ